MKNQVKEYEKFIKEKIENKEFSKELLAYHNEMIHCFQHERLIHLIITLFFVLVAIFFFDSDWTRDWQLWRGFDGYVATLCRGANRDGIGGCLCEILSFSRESHSGIISFDEHTFWD